LVLVACSILLLLLLLWRLRLLLLQHLHLLFNKKRAKEKKHYTSLYLDYYLHLNNNDTSNSYQKATVQSLGASIPPFIPSSLIITTAHLPQRRLHSSSSTQMAPRLDNTCSAPSQGTQGVDFIGQSEPHSPSSTSTSPLSAYGPPSSSSPGSGSYHDSSNETSSSVIIVFEFAFALVFCFRNPLLTQPHLQQVVNSLSARICPHL
jgi:hypothetical protein